MTAGTVPDDVRWIDAGALAGSVRRNAWALGLVTLLGALLLFTRIIHPSFGAFDLESLGRATLPLGLAAAAQAVIVISGGIDLSVGSIMALTNVIAAVLMRDSGESGAVLVVLLVLVLGAVIGALNGGLVVWTKVPDIVVTLAMSFVWSGAALLVLSSPGGSAASWFKGLAGGGFIVDFIPMAAVVLLVTVGAVWLPLQRAKVGLSMYAIGSDALAAFRSGVDVGRTRVAAYAVGGVFAAAGGLALTMTTGIGSPVTGSYTLAAVAAIVLGGVSLAGGIGGIVGPLAAAAILAVIRVDLVFLGIDPNYSVVIQGVIMVVVVMIGIITLRRVRA